MFRLSLAALIGSLAISTMALPVNQVHEEASRLLPTASTEHIGKGKGVAEEPKRLEYRIHNLRTGKEEVFDPTKHVFDPFLHHPDLAEKTQDSLVKQARESQLDPVKMHAQSRHLRAIFDGAKHLTNLGATIVDHNEHYLYSNRKINGEKAHAYLSQGYSKRLKEHEDGTLSLQRSARERQTDKQLADVTAQRTKLISAGILKTRRQVADMDRRARIKYQHAIRNVDPMIRYEEIQEMRRLHALNRSRAGRRDQLEQARAHFERGRPEARRRSRQREA